MPESERNTQLDGKDSKLPGKPPEGELPKYVWWFFRAGVCFIGSGIAMGNTRQSDTTLGVAAAYLAVVVLFAAGFFSAYKAVVGYRASEKK
jgi:hypothetical protein